MQFDEMFGVSDDPWGYRTRWYEKRKRELLLASLTRQRYQRALEIGSANGEVTARLASRVAELVACDASERAIDLSRQKLGITDNVKLVHCDIPGHWPDGKFDLIVMNELGYYLSEDELARTLELCADSLDAAGEMLVCHWRYAIEGCHFTGDDVHARVAQWAINNDLRRLASHLEADFLLEVWTNDSRSIAAREGLR
jgi:cyclopropane fatty-acyl-phospholipid synthase-like methyltransferase